MSMCCLTRPRRRRRLGSRYRQGERGDDYGPAADSLGYH